MQIKLQFEPHYVNCVPVIKVQTSLGQQLIEVASCTTYELDLPSADRDQLSIEFTNKADTEDNWIELKQLELDQINLQNFIFNGRFYPYYNADWYSKQQPPPPEFYCPGTHMRHAGVWQLPIRLPICKTVLDFWIDDER